MHQGNWTCSQCGGAITELPFEPKSDKGLTCRECYFKQKNGGAGASAAPAPSAPAASDDQSDVPPFDPDMAPATDLPDAPPDEPGTAPAGERKMFQGDWHCSICGGSITQLPFEPRNTENLKCIDCFKKSKG